MNNCSYSLVSYMKLSAHSLVMHWAPGTISTLPLVMPSLYLECIPVCFHRIQIRQENVYLQID